VDEQFANPARIGVLSDRRERRTSLLATAAPPSRKYTSAPPLENRILGGLSFRVCVTTPLFVRARLQPCRKHRNIKAALAAEVPRSSFSHRLRSSAITTRAKARFLSVRLSHPGLPGRLSTRAKCSLSVSTNHHSPLTNRIVLPGVPKTPRVLGWLPETVTRVEMHLSYRKQTIAHRSTRNVPAHEKIRLPFAFLPRAGVAKSAYIGRADASKSMVLPCPKQ